MFQQIPVGARPRVTLTNGLYLYHPGSLPMCPPGVGNMAFEMGLSLPLVAIWGRAMLAGAPPSPIQPPQVYQFHQQTTSGIGGLIAGTMAMQPLLVPDNNNPTGP